MKELSFLATLGRCCESSGDLDGKCNPIAQASLLNTTSGMNKDVLILH
jgi:uncharacterized metal-binding protein